MDPKCWKTALSTNGKRRYYINVEKGTSQWGITNYLTPEGWEMHHAKGSNDIYYGNTLTGETQWEQPKFIKPDPLPPGWESRVTDCGNYYYRNESLNISRWENPAKSPVKSPVINEILEDRVLKWVGNSCYLDSALFCLFAGPKDFIDDILYTDLYTKRKEIETGDTSFFCGSSIDTDIVGRKRVQNQLRYIGESITGKSERIVKYCSDFRKTLTNCRPKAGIVLQGDEDKYHTEHIADPGEFLTYLFKILHPVKKAVRTRITYGTNDVTNDFNEIPKNKLTMTSRNFEEISLVNVINNDILLKVRPQGTTISEFIEETDDSGEISLVDGMGNYTTDNLFKADGKVYKRRIQITSIQQSPIIIFSFKRLTHALLGGGICKTPIYPDTHITTGNGQKFVFYAVVINNEGHYTCIAKYGKIWYYYDDNNPPQRLKKYKTFEDAAKDPDNIDPYTQGTQYFYKPI